MADPTNGRADHIRDLRAQREKLLDQAEQLREQIVTEIDAAFPDQGEPPRGTLTALVNATGWTRAHVANIRDAERAARGIGTAAEKAGGAVKDAADSITQAGKD